MSPKVAVLFFTAVVVSFIAGFLIANSLNRSELNNLRSLASATPSTQPSQPNLSAEDIETAIARADANKNDQAMQKNIGMALYRWGSIKTDPEIVGDSIRLLERALELSPDDRDVIVALGHAHFDVGYFKKDNSYLEKARTFYGRALAKRSDDADVRADLGISYFIAEPPQDELAVTELTRSIALDPRHERALEFIIKALVRQGNISEARNYLSKLEQANPSSSSLSGLINLVENPGAAGEGSK